MLVLIDYSPFEILFAIKLTVCCAISTDLSILLLFKQDGRAPQCLNNLTTKFNFPRLMPATTQAEQVSSSN